MDGVTQLQNYASSLAQFMAQSLQHAWQGAGTVSVEQLKQTVQEEHWAADRARAAADAAALDAAASAAASASASASSSSASALAASPDASVSSAPASSSVSVPVPSLDAALYSGLSAPVEHAMADRAHQLLKRALEFDALIQSLPPMQSTENNAQSHVQQVQFLEAASQSAGRRLAEAQEEAGQSRQTKRAVFKRSEAKRSVPRHSRAINDVLSSCVCVRVWSALWQQRVSWVLQQAAACQLRTSTNQSQPTAELAATATANDNNAHASTL
jgi:hypothetical protein